MLVGAFFARMLSRFCAAVLHRAERYVTHTVSRCALGRPGRIACPECKCGCVPRPRAVFFADKLRSELAAECGIEPFVSHSIAHEHILLRDLAGHGGGTEMLAARAPMFFKQ